MEQSARKDIDKQVFDLLKASKSLDVFPTPIDRITDYVELRQSNSDQSLHSIPTSYFTQKLDVLQRALKKVYGAFDRSERIIYINPFIHKNKKAFVQLHETGHAVIPWQKATGYFVDDTITLDADTKVQFEEEANYFASGALFQLDRFKDELLKMPLEIGSPLALAELFGGSKHAGMRRYVEVCPKRCALLVLERKEESPKGELLSFRNCFHSDKFLRSFGDLSWPAIFDKSFPFIQDYLRKRRLHNEGSIWLQTQAGMECFEYHYFNNSHNVFVLLLPEGERISTRTKIYMSDEI
ncbi:ImmA/IrrE family metallo-endopeptidase [Sediminibacterium sp.]|uniref:ImmA/IrrE family metallo-endopeptidase n=1 Tax=Sediminibacterium sp. TaxID=1917865 RepID=UPI00272F2280|nr:ImmA/IrrE family metallo-endopeptidase [Sediminibacterium sp.]MDP2421339.1 ImmA/IrrE family metallo-endopeptidase [Sediminibacterium sp.]